MALPKVTVDGVDICEKYNLIWTNDGALLPPEPRMNLVEIPAMDGFLDLTEALTDDAVFGERTHEFVFFVRKGKDFEEVKTEMCNMLHGRRLDYVLSTDPNYTYTGRWQCDEYPRSLENRKIKFTVHADPWKRGAHQYYTFSAKGGKEIVVFNSRRHVTPVITTKKRTIIEYQGRAWDIPEAGSWTLDLRLQEGVSTIYANTAPSEGDRTWADLAATYSRWRDIPKSMRWCDIYFKRKPVGDTSDYVTIEYDLYDL